MRYEAVSTVYSEWSFKPLFIVMRYADQRCLGLFLRELRNHRASLLRRSGETPPQRHITDFFRPPPRLPEDQSLLHQGLISTPHPIGTLVDQAMEIGRSRRPWLVLVSHCQHRLQQRIWITLTRHARCPIRFLTMEGFQLLTWSDKDRCCLSYDSEALSLFLSLLENGALISSTKIPHEMPCGLSQWEVQ